MKYAMLPRHVLCIMCILVASLQETLNQAYTVVSQTCSHVEARVAISCCAASRLSYKFVSLAFALLVTNIEKHIHINMLHF